MLLQAGHCLAVLQKAELLPRLDRAVADVDSLPLPTLDTFGEAELVDLEDRVAHILRMRSGMVDGEQHTLREVGEELGIKDERVRQIQNQGLLLIRQMREVQRHLRPEPSLRAMYRWWTPRGSSRSGRRGR